MQEQDQENDARPSWASGLLTGIVSICAAFGVVAVIWAVYASLDEQGFAMDRSVVQPVIAWFSGKPAPASATASAVPPPGTVVAGQRNAGPRQP